MSEPLPSTHRALLFSAIGEPLSVQKAPTPEALHGSLIVKVLASSVGSISYLHLIGVPGLTVPAPCIYGNNAIARIAAIGPDTTSLHVGELVMVDSFVRGRDNPDVQLLFGIGVFGGNPAALNLQKNVWRDGLYAEYARVPLENVYALNEDVLTGSPSDGGLGYSFADLTIMSRQLIPYGGLRGIDLKAGETVIIAPATGGFSGAAVEVASAMGAKVIAVGRNFKALEKLRDVNPKVKIHQLKGDFGVDLAALKEFGPVDAFFDISPAQADESSHVRSCLFALKQYGRASLMGALSKDIGIPYVVAMLNNLTIRGQYMYEREDVRGMIKLVESGALKLGKSAGHEIVGEFSLEDWEKAIEVAKNNPEVGKMVVFKP